MLTPSTFRFSKKLHDLCDNYLDTRGNGATQKGFVGVVQNLESSKDMA